MKTKKEAVVPKKAERYVEGVGRRKTSIARVRILGGKGKFVVNDKELKNYFNMPVLESCVLSPFIKAKIEGLFDVSARVSGGGIHAQAEAVRLGLSRALALNNPDFQMRLHKLGFLTRDSRMVERKKYGLRKARRAPQWQKR
ncbi:MAG: 30S ribosomal protein S9 [Candidatus Ryanbacteria bacterium RIFCSPLOWO2_01_FULL_48_26]|uniref:Small ribosomal subunit protein uS9 n=1 Tax=Candidatus Ryanbacteria bacterium RIFCSPLOWO2_01_FULL_48_26 TaxID=1802126 RepID=A0A1G2GWB1_9BACT|nr:MAG: 30S ribosomal protein S9 [Candidatus Ryanbacteria bacterium RIFCSPLOWO2_01_FULL_48_26]